MKSCVLIIVLSILVIGCGSKKGKNGDRGTVTNAPDYTMELGPSPRYDGQTNDRNIYQSYIIKNIGSPVSFISDPVIVRINFLYRGSVDSHVDLSFIPSAMVGNEYKFTINKVFADNNYDVDDWSVESIIDPSGLIVERSESNNSRVDNLLRYPLDPGVPDDPLIPDDLYIENDNGSIDAVIYGASTARFNIVCYGPLVPINGFVKIRMTHFSGGLPQSVQESICVNYYYDLQYGGIPITFACPYDAPDSDFVRVEVDWNNEIDEFNENNNSIDIPLIYHPMPTSNG